LSNTFAGVNAALETSVMLSWTGYHFDLSVCLPVGRSPAVLAAAAAVGSVLSRVRRSGSVHLMLLSFVEALWTRDGCRPMLEYIACRWSGCWQAERAEAGFRSSPIDLQRAWNFVGRRESRPTDSIG